MSDPRTGPEGGAGQGRGQFTRKGVQKGQAEAIASLQAVDEQTKQVLTELDARLTAVEDHLEAQV